MSEGPPGRIDRAALERIIQRAAELQTAEREVGDTLTSDELLALGREVGIPVRYLQQALLEEIECPLEAQLKPLDRRTITPHQGIAEAERNRKGQERHR